MQNIELDIVEQLFLKSPDGPDPMIEKPNQHISSPPRMNIVTIIWKNRQMCTVFIVL